MGGGQAAGKGRHDGARAADGRESDDGTNERRDDQERGGGKELWKGVNHNKAQTSPILWRHAGRKMVIFNDCGTGRSLKCLDLASGAITNQSKAPGSWLRNAFWTT